MQDANAEPNEAGKEGDAEMQDANAEPNEDVAEHDHIEVDGEADGQAEGAADAHNAEAPMEREAKDTGGVILYPVSSSR